jgi:hypothetical protein
MSAAIVDPVNPGSFQIQQGQSSFGHLSNAQASQPREQGDGGQGAAIVSSVIQGLGKKYGAKGKAGAEGADAPAEKPAKAEAPTVESKLAPHLQDQAEYLDAWNTDTLA